MRTGPILILFLFPFFSLYGQKKEKAIDYNKYCKGNYENTGEQERCWTKILFRKEYKKKVYERFKGQVTRSEASTFSFGNDTLKIANTNQSLLVLFEEGIFYPGVISRGYKSDEAQIFSCNISDLKEIEFMRISPKIKRFESWIFTKGFANPSICFIELTNQKATANTDIQSFIKGSKLTFYKTGWVIM